jgi:hypothetical protein
VLVYGSIAVMAGRFTVKGRYNDRDISGQYSYTNVLGRQQRGYWRIVASQARILAATDSALTTALGAQLVGINLIMDTSSSRLLCCQPSPVQSP